MTMMTTGTKSAMTPDVSVVVVSWNVRDLLQRCLTSVEAARADGLSIETIVVDNASHDGSAALVADDFPDALLIANTDNRGFSRGCNQGITAAGGRTVLLLNPDAALGTGSLRAMLDRLDQRPDLGAVGPQLRNEDGTVQSSRRRFPTLPTLFLMSTFIEYKFPGLSPFQQLYANDRPDTDEQDVDWLVGACLLLRRATLQQVGGLDEQFFMYFEEMDWFRRAADAGWQTAYVPAAVAVHTGGRSSAQNLPLRHIRFNASRLRYARKHFGAAAATALRAWLLVAYGVQSGEEALKLAVGHRPEQRRQELGVYLSVLRSGLRP